MTKAGNTRGLTTELAKLNAKREMLISEIEEIFALSRGLDDDNVRGEFYVRVEDLDGKVRKVEELTDRVVDISLQRDPEYTPDYGVVRRVETLRYKIRQAHRKLAGPTQRGEEREVKGYKLPKIPLPEFSGEITEWPLFWEKFSNIIHENPALDTLSKLNYLLGSLKGKALDICAGVTPSAANYDVIISILKSQYDQKRFLADNFLSKMLELKPLTQESVPALSQLVLRFDTAFKSLLNLELPNLPDYLAAVLILRKLDPQTRREFETSKHDKIPSYQEVLTFLNKQIQALSQVPTPPQQNKTRTWPRKSDFSPKLSFVSQTKPSPKPRNGPRPAPACPLCKAAHPLFKCERFASLPTTGRQELINRSNLCTNCLSAQHSTTACNSKHTCRVCNKEHHSLLHPPADKGNPPSEIAKSEDAPFCALNRSKKGDPMTTTLLSTAVVQVVTPKGPHTARFLIDTASQANFITSECCHRLGLTFHRRRTPVSGIGASSTSTMGETNFVIRSRYNNPATWRVQALVVDRIADKLPSQRICTADLEYLKNLPLADEQFAEPSPVDGILGPDIFIKILGSSKVQGPPQFPSALETKLGYILMGPAPLRSLRRGERHSSPENHAFCTFQPTDLTAALERFWELEEVPAVPHLSAEDMKCQEIFEKTTTRNCEGRYCVHLPFKEFPPVLGESWTTAVRRFLALERQFRKSQQFFEQYSQVIQDYLTQGHLSEVSNPEIQIPHSVFIPHFAVFKESSSTPLRIVFDASAKTSNGSSLNNALLTGPKLQKEIFEILTAFRVAPIALTADIRQMYRNIEVTPEHRRFQRILWRESPAGPLGVFELTSVVFGLTSAPYLAIRTVEQLANDESSRFPVAARLAKEGMYVDDLVVSLESPQEAVMAFHELVGMFKAGGFRLTKWSTNSPALKAVIPAEDLLHSPINFSDSSNMKDCIKILGLNWTAHSDAFSFQVQFPSPVFTKRGIMSTVARIWDPLGFLAPVTLFAKCLVKELWISKVAWDEEIPAKLHEKWKAFHTELNLLSDFKISRHVDYFADCRLYLAGFCDSSEQGYGAVIYSLVENSDGQVTVCLLCAKSKVSPLKVCSLPRLELCAAVLLAKLMSVCVATLATKVAIHSLYAFTDSSVALTWITGEPHQWKTFVANRVAKIQLLVPTAKWFHVRSEINIADCISRGQSPYQFMQNTMWSDGPLWLRSPSNCWPITSKFPGIPSSELLERKAFTILVNQNSEITTEFEDLLKRFSSWKKLLRVIVYILRFAKRLPIHSRITPEDLEYAEAVLIKQTQRCHFSEEFKLLEKSQSCSPNLQRLAPFLDNNILRVGGRISRADLDFRFKHPALLPKDSHLATLIIDDVHQSNLHTGPNLVLALVRQRFWIVNARNLIRKRFRSCNICFKAKPQPVFPPMADLPAARVLEAKPFLHTGVDYAGPFSICISRRRGAKTQKAYLCLFVCLGTKAVHLELASSLSSEAFLSCFTRFVSRRGPVSCLYSDRGTNFIGAKTELDKLYKLSQSEEFSDPLKTYLLNHRINWVFNPPRAPHFGGIWESNVKSVKNHLSKVIGTQILSYEELATILTQVEALLNSRPLCHLSDDPSEATALTPAHFLNLLPVQDLPVSKLPSTTSIKTRKELLDSIVRCFWRRWHLEYLSSLQLRPKWNTPVTPLAVGTVVLVKEEGSPPFHWPLGVVEQVFPGPDGVVRVADVRVGGTSYRRPVVKLCPLPTQ